MSSPKVVYNEHERHTLVELVKQHQAVIDSKRVDAETLSKKRLIWTKITNEYNRQPRVRKRLTQQLRRLWENIKARAKKASTGPSASHDALNESIDEPSMSSTHIGDSSNELASDLDGIYASPSVAIARNYARKPKIRSNRLSDSSHDKPNASIEGPAHARDVDVLLGPSKLIQPHTSLTHGRRGAISPMIAVIALRLIVVVHCQSFQPK